MAISTRRKIQFPDFVILSNNFGRTGGSVAVAVPEPSTGLLGLSCVALFAVRGRLCRERGMAAGRRESTLPCLRLTSKAGASSD